MEWLPEAPRADNALWDDECTSPSAISSILAALLHLLHAAIVSSTWHNTGWNLQLRASTSEEEADTAPGQIWQICRNNEQWKCCRSSSWASFQSSTVFYSLAPAQLKLYCSVTQVKKRDWNCCYGHQPSRLLPPSHHFKMLSSPCARFREEQLQHLYLYLLI